MTFRCKTLRLLGLLWVIMGLTVLFAGSPIDPGNAILYEVWPVHLRVFMWIATGVPAIIASYRCRGTMTGFALLLVMPVERASALIWSQIQWIIPGPPPGTIGIAGAILWLLIGALIWNLSRWPDSKVATKGER